ncbi:polysaccharide deacetylase family protein [Afifella aestuarii]|uniref:polysaccharide deacetylase family protein n=1 Tax=Afifella aestuarii TaxID=1909496 RepID=UPI000FE379AE|nr:polysaccharide deacetylase family protein [Afifella aestuarii]
MEEAERFCARLDAAAETGRALSFWWRDDDATEPTPELDRLAGLFGEIDEARRPPLGLAVIPDGARPALVDRLAREPYIAILQHGLAHRNHAQEGEKKSEFPLSRPLTNCLADVKTGRTRLLQLFDGRLLPVFVPPWNNVSHPVLEGLTALGIQGLSRFGATKGACGECNTHLDIIEWRHTRGFIGREAAFRLLTEEAERRLAGASEPIGILTHHLAHDQACWDFSRELLTLLANHPGAAFPPLQELFALREPGYPTTHG